jgi:hypothetical protein
MKKPIVLVIALVVSAVAVKAQSIYTDSLAVKKEFAVNASSSDRYDQKESVIESMPAYYAESVYIMDEATTPPQKPRTRKKRFFSFLKK